MSERGVKNGPSRRVEPAKFGMAGWGFGLSLFGAAVLMMAGPLYQLDVLPLMGAFGLLAFAPLIAIGSLYVAATGAILARIDGNGRAVLIALVGVAVSVAVIAIPLSQRLKARSVPPIHDITTDPGNPPVFVDALAARAGAPNSADYGGPDIAAQQRAAYPNVTPLVLETTAGEAFDRALAAAKEMHWDLIAENRGEGRIEATDTTFWFGFKDDIVIRLSPAPDGVRVDVRSLSRVGMSDIGTNARRVEAFLARLREKKD